MKYGTIQYALKNTAKKYSGQENRDGGSKYNSSFLNLDT